MLEEVRELLRKIDLIVESEARRLNDEIDNLRQQLKFNKENAVNIATLKAEIKLLVEDLECTKKELWETQNKLEACKKEINRLTKEIITSKKQINRLKSELDGYMFTVNVISEWIPSQKENIDVLITLSSSPEHSATIEHIHNCTKIAKVTLKNRIIPILEKNGLISVDNNKIKLAITD